jgi:hypothetical protein
MRDLRLLDAFRLRGERVREWYGWDGDETCGAFVLPSPLDRGDLMIIASAEGGWDHVSVSRRNRCPNWAEMEHVAQRFFADDETAMQLHVPAGDHVNNHPHCLHWWRPQDQPIPRPPSVFVGIGQSAVQSAEEARLMHRKAMAAVVPWLS